MQFWNLSLEDRIDKHSLFKVFELNTTSLLEKKKCLLNFAFNSYNSAALVTTVTL